MELRSLHANEANDHWMRSIPQHRPLVLLTGATGYVGSRLARLLEKRDVSLRCLARSPDKLRQKVSESTQVVQGGVLDKKSLDVAMAGVETAYYLVHLMASFADFEANDREAAENFGSAAKQASVKRIIYLGGLGEDTDPKLSPHLRSRHEVGEILRISGVETIEFWASVVVGAGSFSYDMFRSLTDQLPVMICPRWLATPTQPIAVDDVLAYLLAALDLSPGESRILEIGGTDIVTYGDLIREYVRQRGLRRILISVPVLTPYLSSLWLWGWSPQLLPKWGVICSRDLRISQSCGIKQRWMRSISANGFNRLSPEDCEIVIDFIEQHSVDHQLSMRLLGPSLRKLIYAREELLDRRPLVKTQLQTLGRKQQATKRLNTKAHDMRYLRGAITKHPDDVNEQQAYSLQITGKSSASYYRTLSRYRDETGE